MNNSRFTYTTYIAAKPEKVWEALISPSLTAQYWQHENVSDWNPGSTWEHRRCDKSRTVDMVGKVVEYTRPRRLVLTWAVPQDEPRKEEHSRVTLEIEPYHGVSRVTVTHDGLEAGSEMLKGITEGWPIVLSSMKSMLETGQALPELWEEEPAGTAGKAKSSRP